jgi:hypothetical protein
MIASIIGGILLLGGVAAVIVHYTIESGSLDSYVSLAVAAAMLVVGWGLFDWGMGIMRRWGSGNGDDEHKGFK